MRFHLLALCAVLLAITGATYAYPALIGPSGIVAVPHGDVIGFGEFQLAADFYNTDDVALLDNAYTARVLVGVAPGLEVGAAYWLVDLAGDDQNTWSVNAKFDFPIGFFGFDTALGAVYGQTDLPGDDLKITQFYLVGQRNLIRIPGDIQSLRLILGANWTDFDNGGSDSGVRGVAGVELELLERLFLGAEYQTEKDDLGDEDALTSLVARVQVSGGLSIEAGYTNADPATGGFTSLDEHNLFLGIVFGHED